MSPSLTGAAVQLGSAVISACVSIIFGLGEATWLVLQVFLAIGMSAMLKQPRWWLLIHLLFMPLVVGALWLDVSPGWYLALFLIAFAVFGRVDKSRVPLYLSNAAALSALAKLVPKQGRVLDLGAGTGTALAYLARHGEATVEGVEHAWVPWLIAWLRLKAGGLQATVRQGNLMEWPLATYDVVYAFLSPAAMPALWEKAKREMQSGALLVSNSFEIPGVEADSVIECSPGRGGRLYVWRMP